MSAKIIQSKVTGYVFAVLGGTAITVVALLVPWRLHNSTVALAMVLMVLFVAIFWGSYPGLVASVFGVFCLNYFFFRPRGQLIIEDVEDFVDLAAFLVAAITVGQLSARAKRRAAEAEAERREARRANAYNRSLLEASIDPLAAIGKDGKVTDVNPATESVTGYSRSELIGTDFSDYFTDSRKAQAGYQQVFREGVVRNYSLDIRHRDGHETPVLYNASVYRDETGEVAGVFAAARDIAERKRAEAALRESEENLKKAQAIAHVGSWYIDITTGRLTWSDEVYRINGVPIGQKMTLEDILAIIHPEDRDAIRKEWAFALQGTRFDSEHRLVVGDQLRWVRVIGDVEFGKEGRPVRGIGTVQDITERKKAEGALRESEENLKKAQATAHVGSWHLDIATGRVTCSDEVYRITGAPKGQTMTFEDVIVKIHPEDRDAVKEEWADALQGTPFDSEHRLLVGDQLRWVRVIGDVEFGKEGRPVWGIGTVQDITERKKAEDALRESEANLQKAQAIAHVGSWHLDIATGRLTWSDEVFRIFELQNNQSLTHEYFMTRVHPEDREMLDDVWAAALVGAPYDVEHRILVDGGVKWVRERASVEFDKGGKAVRGIGTVQDITERKLAQERLTQSAEEIHDLYNNAPCGYHSLDQDGTYVRINDTELRWLGYTRAEVVGRKKFSDFLAPESRRGFEEEFDRFKREEVVQDLVYEMVRKDGTLLPVLLSATVIRDEDGNYVMSRATVYDIAARKKAEDEVRLLARLQTVLAGLGEYALRGTGLDDVFDETVSQVSWALGTECCKVLELLPNREECLLRSGVGWKPGYVGKATVSVAKESQAGYTLLSGEPVVVEDFRTDKRFTAPELLSEHGVVSGVSVVIPTKTGPFGVFGAHTRNRRRFTVDEVNFLQTVSNVLGSAIERHRAEVQLLRINRTNRALSRCNEALVRATEEPKFLQQICSIIVEEAGYRLCWVGHAESDEEKSVQPLAQAGFEEGYLDNLKITWADTERGRGPTGTSIRTRQTLLVRNIEKDPLMTPWREDALKRGYRSSLAIPLLVDSEVFGALNIYAEAPDAFSPEEVDLLTELADDLAFGIVTLRTRAERVKAEEGIRRLNADLERRVIERTTELETANMIKDKLLVREQAVTAELERAHEREADVSFRIQKTLLLDQPPIDVSGLRVAAMTIPSQRIDGDFYVFLRHRNECLDVIVGDVMGKGVPAALVGAATKSYFLKALSHLMAFSRDGKLPEPKEIVMLSHAEVVRQLIDLESFVTLSYARLDVIRRQLDLVDCGHTGIVQVHAKTGDCEILHGENLPLGVREGEIYDQITVPFEPGDLFFFFSDGITEARNNTGELFGIDRLVECIRTNSQLEPGAFIQAIRSAVFAFSGTDRLSDDLTSVAVRVESREVALAREEMEIRSDLSQLCHVRQFVSSFCHGVPGAPVSQESICSLELAANEAASNIMKHAYHGRTDRWIHLEGEAFPSRILIRLYHLGDPFDPSGLPPPVLDGSQESGFGAYIISKSTDDVRYYRDERGMNCITLVKARKLIAGKEIQLDGSSCRPGR